MSLADLISTIVRTYCLFLLFLFTLVKPPSEQLLAWLVATTTYDLIFRFVVSNAFLNVLHFVRA